MDLHQVQDKLKRPLDDSEMAHCGVSQLRRFLEQILQQRYLESVPAIVPLLEQEFRNTVRARRDKPNIVYSLESPAPLLVKVVLTHQVFLG
jgi:hypothetical protein